MSDPDFCLRFIEGFHEEELRRCWRVKRIAIGAHADSLLVRVDPTYLGRDYGVEVTEIESLILSPKYQEGSLFPINEMPLDVYVFLPMITEPELRDVLAPNEVKKIAFGEIYLDGERRTQPTGPRQTNPW